MQEAVKNTEIVIPFIFYDGTNIPAGSVRLKKGDPVWLFLDRCRKVGAELGVGGKKSWKNPAKNKKHNRREWAMVSVDDLMLVKGEVIVPHVRVWAIISGGFLDFADLTFSTTSYTTSSPIEYPIFPRMGGYFLTIQTNPLHLPLQMTR